MTVNDQENEKTSELKNELFKNRGQRRYYGFNLFTVIDREYVENLSFPEGNNKKSTLSTVIYMFGVIIFFLGAIESFTVAQLIGTNSLRNMQLSGIGLLTAFISGMIFIGFGKVVELIVKKGK
jgi:hypothetical protein